MPVVSTAVKNQPSNLSSFDWTALMHRSVSVCIEPASARDGRESSENATWPCRVQEHADMRKLATRRALGVAAVRLAVQRGLDNVHVDDIAAEAGVSARTFNNYFASKYEAICALAMDRGRLIGVALRSRPPGEPLMEAITHAVLEPYAGATQTPDKDWIDGVRLVVRSPALQGEYLRTHHAAQETLAR